MCSCDDYRSVHSRRDFLSKSALGLGALSLASLVDPLSVAGKSLASMEHENLLPHFMPKAKRVIYLFQSGGPSQLELFDEKPLLKKMQGQELPESVRKGQRLTGMTSGQSSLPLAGSIYDFSTQGKSGTNISELLPYTSQIVDELCLVKSMYTEAINHDPAITFIQTGSQFPGRPSIGSWLNYGLGSDNQNLPAFVVLVTKNKFGQPL